MNSPGRDIRYFARRRVTGPLVAIGLIFADTPGALAQEPAPAAPAAAPSTPEAVPIAPGQPAPPGTVQIATDRPPPLETVQIATEKPRRPRRPPVDPATRELRQTRGMLAGGVVLTALCGVGFGLVVYVVADSGAKLQGASGGRVIGAGGAMLACTALSIAAIGVGASRLRARKRVAWAGGLGLHF